MHILLRVTLLSGFAAAGVGMALVMGLKQPDPARDARPKLFALARHEEPAAAAGRSAPPQPAPPPPETSEPQPSVPSGNPASEPPSTKPPLTSKIEALEMKLDMIQEAAKQNQIARLEDKLGRIEAAAWQRQRKFEEVAVEQQRQLAEAARQQQQMLLALVEAVDQKNKSPDSPAPEAAAPAEAAAAGPSAPEPLPPAQPTEPQIHKGEGDDMLTLNLRDDDLREVLEFLSAEGDLNILAMESVQGKVTATLTNVDIQTALSAILKSTGYVARYEDNFVYVGKPEDFQQMDQLEDQIDTRIYRPNYVTARELEKLVTPILTPNVGTVTVSSPAQVDLPSDAVRTGGDDFAGNEVLMVRDYEAVLLKVDEVVAQVDERPRQVAIEAMILSVNLDDAFKLGVDFEVLRHKAHIRVIGNSPLMDLASIDASDGGLHFGFLDGSLTSFINALETFGDTDVIASPHLVCLNKQRAEVLIGDQKGYLSTTQTETATTQTVEFLDVGTQLRIRPFISADGMIRLEVHPELSTGDVKLLGDFALPEKSTTQVTTNILCRDGCTVVIGGLIREDVANSTTQVPVLGNLPVLGAILRNRNETVTRNEIIILITPRIIHDPGQCAQGKPCQTELARRRALSHNKQRMTSIACRHYGQRYYRLAESAWRADDLSAAVDYLELSLHFFPENPRALRLQAAIFGTAEPDPAGIDLAAEPISDVPLEELKELETVGEAKEAGDPAGAPASESAENVRQPADTAGPASVLSKPESQDSPPAPARRLFEPPPVTAKPAAFESALEDEPPVPPNLDFLDDAHR